MLGLASANGAPPETPAARGYRLLRTKAYLPADFDQEVFDSLWKRWPEPRRSRAAEATLAKRRRMTRSYYGLVEVPGESDGSGPGIGYVDNGQGGWVINCLACHAGRVNGRIVPGLGNSRLALQTLTEDVRATKLALGKTFAHLDLASLKIPLGTTNGTTNAVVFGIVLGALRDADMNFRRPESAPKLVHHDMDAPPLWNVRKKTHLYADGFVAKTHRPLLQFILLPTNDAETIEGWEDDFRDILAWIESLEPPQYPWNIDADLAGRGKRVFRRTCSRCHGTYGPEGKYVQKRIPLETVGTDPVRLRALTREHREWMRRSWMSRYGKDEVLLDPDGYVAPPLDGIWASAPYFHNGSVPTLWHVLHADERPIVWKHRSDEYDRERVGLNITAYEDVPTVVRTPAERRHYFDTREPGKSAAGHRFPEALTEDEKRAVLEFLKSL